MKRIPKRYTLRRRKNARRWELIIRDGAGMGDWIYAGLYKEFDDALQSLRDNWGLTPSAEDLHTSAVIKENRKRFQELDENGSMGAD